MSDNYLWDREDMEEIITKAYIGLYETDCLLDKRRIFKKMLVTEADIKRARSIGCYFTPKDRIIMTGPLDLRTVDLPETASWTDLFGNDRSDGNEDNMRDFITFTFIRRLKKLPRGFTLKWAIAYYELMLWYPQLTGGAYFIKHLLGILPNGVIKMVKHDNLNVLPEDKDMELLLSGCIQYDDDKKHLWNVCATEGEIKGTFGVYNEQIQSLFYARDLPMTETGRKRPILHWVESHKRRMRNGTEVAIEGFLRGITKFEMNGTLFEIMNPIKGGHTIEEKHSGIIV